MRSFSRRCPRCSSWSPVTGLEARADDPLALGLKTIQSMAGCYLVDYNYVEVESLKPGYARDERVYDVNRDKSVKEWDHRRSRLPPPGPSPAHPLLH